MDVLGGQWLGFPYAVRLAEERGATRVLIEPRVTDPTINGWIEPDILAERTGRKPLIIEIGDSTATSLAGVRS